METAANVGTVEKPKNGFPTVPTIAWKTLRKKRSEFPTVPTAPTAGSTLKLQRNETFGLQPEPIT